MGKKFFEDFDGTLGILARNFKFHNYPGKTALTCRKFTSVLKNLQLIFVTSSKTLLFVLHIHAILTN